MPTYNNPNLSDGPCKAYSNAFTEIIARLESMTEAIQNAPAPDFATVENFEAMCNLRYYLEMAQGELKNL